MKQLDEIRKICREVKSGAFAPVYLLCGEEPYFIDKLSSYFEDHTIEEEFRAFNQHILYGNALTTAQVLEYAKQFPIGGDRTLVVVREAQNLDKSIDALESYLKHPQPSTVLVLCWKYKAMDKRKAVYKGITKIGVVFQSGRLYENQVNEWLVEVLRQRKLGIAPDAMMLLLDFLGSDLTRIDNEIKKMALVLAPESLITTGDIERNIGISKEFNNYELQRAVGAKDYPKAMRIVDFMSRNKDNHPIASVSILYGFFTKLITYHVLPTKTKDVVASELGINPYFVLEYQGAAKNYNLKQAVHAIEVLRDIDMKAKGVDAGSISVGDLYRELVFRLMAS